MLLLSLSPVLASNSVLVTAIGTVLLLTTYQLSTIPSSVTYRTLNLITKNQSQCCVQVFLCDSIKSKSNNHQPWKVPVLLRAPMITTSVCLYCYAHPRLQYLTICMGLIPFDVKEHSHSMVHPRFYFPRGKPYFDNSYTDTYKLQLTKWSFCMCLF